MENHTSRAKQQGFWEHLCGNGAGLGLHSGEGLQRCSGWEASFPLHLTWLFHIYTYIHTHTGSFVGRHLNTNAWNFMAKTIFFQLYSSLYQCLRPMYHKIFTIWSLSHSRRQLRSRSASRVQYRGRILHCSPPFEPTRNA